MIKNRFVKNLYQITSFAASELVILIPILAIYFLMLDSNAVDKSAWMLYVVIVLVLLFFIVGFYWIFQIVEINSSGIVVKLFNRVIRSIRWEDVEDIRYANHFRNPVYNIIIKENKILYLDYRKKIKNAIICWGNDDIKEMMKRI
jgi:hypothetical protein